MQHSCTISACRSCCNTCLVGLYGLGGVLVAQVQVANGIIYLCLIIGILVRFCHALELAQCLLVVAVSRHLGLAYACVELKLIGRALRNGLAKALVGLLLVAGFGIQLSKQIVFACLVKRCLAFALQCCPDIWDCLLAAFLLQQQIGLCHGKIFL